VEEREDRAVRAARPGDGQAVVWYTGQFYALFFLGSVLKVDGFTTNMLIAWSLLLGSGGFVLFGWLSDKIGRKPIILGGCLIAALTYFPLFHLISAEANPALTQAHQNITTTLEVDRSTCSFQFNPTGTARFTQPCDTAKARLAALSVNYTVEDKPGPARRGGAHRRPDGQHDGAELRGSPRHGGDGGGLPGGVQPLGRADVGAASTSRQQPRCC
jgi:hypothetical protein